MTQEQPAQHIRQAVGPFLQGQLALSVQMNRLDIIFSAVANNQAFITPSKPAILGGYEEVSKTLKQYHPMWLSLIDEKYERIAISLVVNWFTDSPDRSRSEFLKTFSGLGFEGLDVTDLLLQFNMRKNLTGFPSDKLNLVQKWLAAQLQVLNIGNIGNFPPQVSVFDCLRLELDANTPPDTSLNVSGSSLAILSTEIWAQIDRIITER